MGACSIDTVFGPDEWSVVQSVYDGLVGRIKCGRRMSQEDKLRVAHVVIEFGKLGVLDAEELTALATTELSPLIHEPLQPSR